MPDYQPIVITRLSNGTGLELAEHSVDQRETENFIAQQLWKIQLMLLLQRLIIQNEKAQQERCAKLHSNQVHCDRETPYLCFVGGTRLIFWSEPEIRTQTWAFPEPCRL